MQRNIRLIKPAYGVLRGELMRYDGPRLLGNISVGRQNRVQLRLKHYQRQ